MTASIISEEEAAALLEKKNARAGEARPLDLAKLRITNGRMPLLETVLQSCSGSFCKAMGALLKREVQVSLQRIETQRAADYFAALTLPACLHLVNVKSLTGSALVAIEPALISIMVDSFYGGSGRSTARDPERALTPSELRFALTILKQFFGDLKAAWAPVKALEFELGKYESNHTFINICSPGDNVLINRFYVEMAGGTGIIDFVMPEAMFAPVREAMRGSGAAPRADSGANWPALLREHLKDMQVEVRASMAHTRINLRELRGLKVGDVIPMEAPGAGVLLVDGAPVYAGKFGISRGHNALKLTGPVNKASK